MASPEIEKGGDAKVTSDLSSLNIKASEGNASVNIGEAMAAFDDLKDEGSDNKASAEVEEIKRKSALRKIKVDKQHKTYLMDQFELNENVVKRVLQTYNNDLAEAVQYLISTSENIVDRHYMKW